LAQDGNTFHVKGTHTYADEGDRSVSITIHHDSANDVNVTSTLHVTDPDLARALPITGIVVTATEGTDSGLQTVASFVDPGGPEALGNYAASIGWGDQQTSAGVITLAKGVFTVQGHHLYAEEGT